MTTPLAPASQPKSLRAFTWITRALLVVWAGFWAWFVVMVSLGEPPPPPWWIPTAWLGGLAALVALTWWRPAVGGVVLLAAGLWAARYFPNSQTRLLLAMPSIVLGLVALATSWSARRLAPAVMFLLCLPLFGCLAPQDPADLPYRTSSILRHDNGRLQRGHLVEETTLEGLPARRWVWLYEDGRLDNIELARDLSVQGHAFPQGTRVFFDREGHLAHAWLSANTTLDGLPCRGRWKIDTAFHPNGHVRAFFPPEDYEIDGVLCEASVFHPVYLHPDGHLAQCKLARDVVLDGRTFERGTILALDASGKAMVSSHS
jgi:hypothetical protein